MGQDKLTAPFQARLIIRRDGQDDRDAHVDDSICRKSRGMQSVLFCKDDSNVHSVPSDHFLQKALRHIVLAAWILKSLR